MTIRPEAEQLAAHVADLRHRIEEAAYQYYIEDNPVLTDAEYDQLMLELQRIEEDRVSGILSPYLSEMGHNKDIHAQKKAFPSHSTKAERTLPDTLMKSTN